jgi:hypothetical protein
MAVGLPLKTTYANGDVYSASDVNDTNGTVNLIGQTNNFYAGKNKIINGDFNINQRNFTSNTAGNSYNFDRWTQFVGGATGTLTTTPQTFTLGSAPVAGYEGKNFVQCVTASGASADTLAVLAQKLESVRTFAGQTITISFWAKATSGTPKIGIEVEQSFGTGGSPSADVATQAGAVTLSTSWARYSATVAVPSISGKTIGTVPTDYLGVYLWLSAGSTFATRASNIGLQNNTFQVWGVQAENGSTATAFQTATGTLQGELAACQRYFTTSYDIGVAPASNSSNGAISFSPLTTSTYPWFPSTTFKSTMRVAPSVTAYNPVTGSTSQPVRNGNANTNHPMYILNIGCNGFVSYVDNSSISGGNSIYFHYTASAEL